MKMQDFTDGIKTIFENLPIPLRAATLALVLSVLRLAYDEDRRRWRRKALETGICFFGTWTVGAGLKGLGLPVEASYLVAVLFGWMGADWVREHAAAAIAKKTDKL